MPRKQALTDSEKFELLKIPDSSRELGKYYSLSKADLALIAPKRGDHNKLGFAMLLCCLRYPGITMHSNTLIPNKALQFVSEQIGCPEPEVLEQYFKRRATRLEHIIEISKKFGFKIFTQSDYKRYIKLFLPLAKTTDKAYIIAQELIIELRDNQIIIPEIPVIEKFCSEIIHKGTKAFYKDLIQNLSKEDRRRMDDLLFLKSCSKITYLTWIQQPANIPNPKHIMEHISRLKYIKRMKLSDALGKNVHINKLSRLPKEGKKMFAKDIKDLETDRKYATLAAIILETKSLIIDEIVELNDRMFGIIFNKARNSHKNDFEESAKIINDSLVKYCKIGTALIDAKKCNQDLLYALESIISWEGFEILVKQTEKLTKPNNFDYLYRISAFYSWIKIYTGEFLKALEFKSSGNSLDLLEGVKIIEEIRNYKIDIMPKNPPLSFIKKRWKNLVFNNDRINNTFYEIATLSELKNALRSGDIWVLGSKKFKSFDEYLIDETTCEDLKNKEYSLPIAQTTKFENIVLPRLNELSDLAKKTNELAKGGKINDVYIDDEGMTISPLNSTAPPQARAFSNKIYSMLPKIKITHLLQEIDDLVGFTRHFTHLKNEKIVEDRDSLLTVILADAINLGLTKMTESCPGSSYSTLATTQAWYVREDTYKLALAEITNAIHTREISSHWGDGTRSSSDGQRFRAGGVFEKAGYINPKYGSEPGTIYYSHISDMYAAFQTNIITSNARNATYVLDGLLQHEADIDIQEHFTDTSGFTDHVFALMYLLGFKFSPRIRNIKDHKIYLPSKDMNCPNLSGITGGNINLKLIEENFDQITRLALSIKQGTVSASLLLKKLSNFPRKNNLSLALSELGKIERCIFTLNWITDPILRKRVNSGLNKGESKNALNRAVHFNRHGEVRDRTFENQLYKASGLNLVTNAITLWNSIYIEKALKELRNTFEAHDTELLKYISPLGWGHINLTGDYIWKKPS